VSDLLTTVVAECYGNLDATVPGGLVAGTIMLAWLYAAIRGDVEERRGRDKDGF
jgi:hypothetical protein